LVFSISRISANPVGNNGDLLPDITTDELKSVLEKAGYIHHDSQKVSEMHKFCDGILLSVHLSDYIVGRDYTDLSRALCSPYGLSFGGYIGTHPQNLWVCCNPYTDVNNHAIRNPDNNNDVRVSSASRLFQSETISRSIVWASIIFWFLLFGKDQKHSVLMGATFLIPFMFNSAQAQTCNAIPIALGNITSCSGNVCYLNQVVNFAIPTAPGSSVCLMFVSPDGISPVQYLNLTVDYSDFVFNPDFQYYTDDPRVTPPAKCICPPGAQATIQTCQWNVYNNYPSANKSGTIWMSGNNPGVNCPGSYIGLTATHCCSIGFEMAKRFKILHFPQNPTKQFQLTTSFNSTINGTNTWNSWSMQYKGIPAYSTSPTGMINTTIISDTSTYSSFWEFLLFDIQANTDYYMLTSSDVNGIDGWDPHKIGYIRVDSYGKATFAPNLQNNIGVIVDDCLNNIFRYNFPWHNTQDMLDQRKRYTSENVWPQSIFVDPEFYYAAPFTTQSYVKEEPQHSVFPYYYIRDGWLLMNNGPPFIGLTDQGTLTPAQTGLGFPSSDPMFQNVSSNCGYYNLTNVNNNIGWTNIYYYDVGTNQPALMQLWSWGGGWVTPPYNASTNICYAICTFKIGGTTSLYAINGGCKDINMTAYAWPSMQPAIFTFNNTGFWQTPSGYTPPLSATKLYGPVNNGVINVQMQFNNLEIQFSNSMIQPKITSVGTDNISGLWVTAQSVTVGGVCYISTNPPGVIITQPITLGVSLSNYSYNFNQAQYTGVLGLVIECAAQLATTTLLVNYNLSPNSSNFQNATNPNQGKDWWFPGDWDFKLPGFQFPDNLSNKIIDWLVLFAYAIGAFLGILLLAFILYKIIVCTCFLSKLSARKTKAAGKKAWSYFPFQMKRSSNMGLLESKYKLS